MPTFLPMMPVTIVMSSGLGIRGSGFGARGSGLDVRESRIPNPGSRIPDPGSRLFPVFLAERLDLHVHPRRQVELHERVNGLRRWLEDVDQTLVRPDLELL